MPISLISAGQGEIMSSAQAFMVVMLLALAIGGLLTFLDRRRTQEEKEFQKKISKFRPPKSIKKG
jgi:hypothetical protein